MKGLVNKYLLTYPAAIDVEDGSHAGEGHVRTTIADRRGFDADPCL
jgi:hypothetical protein